MQEQDGFACPDIEIIVTIPAMIEQAVKTHTDVQNEVLAVLEPEQRQNLAGLLKKILLNLSDEKGAVSS